MTDEDKYVLRHEWERNNGKIHQRINEVDNKHVNLHNDLRLLVTRLDDSSKIFNDNQKETIRTLEKINTNVTGLNERIRDVEYSSRSVKERLDTMEATADERRKGNAQIWVAVIGSIATIVVGALTFAQVFF